MSLNPSENLFSLAFNIFCKTTVENFASSELLYIQIVIIIIIIHSAMIRHKPALFMSLKLELYDNRHPITGLEIEEKNGICYFFLI